MVTVTLNGKGEMRQIKIDPQPGRSGRGRDPGGPDRGGVQRCQGQGRGARPGRDGQAHRRHEPAARPQAAVLRPATPDPVPMAAPRARRADPAARPAAGARAALGAARGAAPAEAARDAAAAPRGGARQRRARGAASARSAAISTPPTRAGSAPTRARRRADLRRRGGRRSLGAGARRAVQGPLPRARRHALGARRARAPRISASTGCCSAIERERGRPR